MECSFKQVRSICICVTAQPLRTHARRSGQLQQPGAPPAREGRKARRRSRRRAAAFTQRSALSGGSAPGVSVPVAVRLRATPVRSRASSPSALRAPRVLAHRFFLFNFIGFAKHFYMIMFILKTAHHSQTTDQSSPRPRSHRSRPPRLPKAKRGGGDGEG